MFVYMYMYMFGCSAAVDHSVVLGDFNRDAPNENRREYRVEVPQIIINEK